MTITDQQWMDQIVLEVGDIATSSFPNGLIKTNIDQMWALWADRAALGTRAQYLYVKRDAIDVLMGYVREQVTTEAFGDTKINLSDKAKNLRVMRLFADTEIERTLKRLQAKRALAVGGIARVAPILPPSQRPIATIGLEPDANDDRFKGDPYSRDNLVNPLSLGH